MDYQRFLTNRDYKAVLTDEQFEMLIQGNEYRLVQAEQAAEMNFIEYLEQYYEVEKLLKIGKCIREYNSGVTYPAKVWFKKDGTIYRTLVQVRGCRKPTNIVYWEQLTELFAIPDLEYKPKYSQLHTYAIGDIVKFGTEWWVCKVPNGYNLNNIQMPGVVFWKAIETTPWEPNMEWVKNDVCEYNGEYYIMTKEADIETPSEDTDTEKPQSEEVGDIEPEPDDTVITPDLDESWGLIGEYSEDYEYDSSEGSTDYVVSDDEVYVAVLPPNADHLASGVNVTEDDPRNINIVTHMTRIAVYYLHQIVSPTNISETRRYMFEDSMTWLANASRFKINPRIPRKKECGTGENKVDWAMETFQRDFNPYDNAWLI